MSSAPGPVDTAFAPGSRLGAELATLLAEVPGG